jgi:hypothetical protein
VVPGGALIRNHPGHDMPDAPSRTATRCRPGTEAMGLAFNRRPADSSYDEGRLVMGLGLAVAVAGALRTLARYAVHTHVVHRGDLPIPVSTFAVNVVAPPPLFRHPEGASGKRPLLGPPSHLGWGAASSHLPPHVVCDSQPSVDAPGCLVPGVSCRMLKLPPYGY